MLLSKKTSIKVSREYANLIGHMCYAASKLWNVCNYERQHYKETGMEQYPDWYYQKKAHKEDLWYKQLPSQTAQEVCKLLDKAWKSFYALKRSGGIETPRPPRFKQESIPITYMQMGIVHERDTDRVRLSLPKTLKKYMEETYQIHENFLYLENKIFTSFELQEYVALDGIYAKSLYRILKQWKMHGCTKKYSVSEFKELLSTPDYEPKILMRDVIKPAVEEINKSGAFKNLRCEVIHAKKARTPS